VGDIGDTYRDRDVLVTGGAGFLGSHLVERLVASGARVRVIDDFSSGCEENIEQVRDSIALSVGDVRDERLLESVVSGCSVVFHLAAIPSVDASVRDPVGTNDVNLAASVKLFKLCGELGVENVVFASSSAVYGVPESLPISESHPVNPISPYGLQKLSSERYGLMLSRTLGYVFVALRFFNIYGPRQDPESPYAAVIPRFVEALIDKRAPVIFGDGEQTRDFVYVSDALDALVLAGSSERSGVFNVASGVRTSVLDLAAILVNATGGPKPVHAPVRPGDIRHSWADISLIESQLGYKPTHLLDSGLERYMTWFRSRA